MLPKFWSLFPLPSSLPKIGVVVDLVEKIPPLAAAQAKQRFKSTGTRGTDYGPTDLPATKRAPFVRCACLFLPPPPPFPHRVTTMRLLPPPPPPSSRHFSPPAPPPRHLLLRLSPSQCVLRIYTGGVTHSR